MKKIVVHIDRLVLRGVERHDAAAVAEGVQAELQRRLASAPPSSFGSAHRIVAGEVHVSHSRGSAVGVAVAGRIAKEITR